MYWITEDQMKFVEHLCDMILGPYFEGRLGDELEKVESFPAQLRKQITKEAYYKLGQTNGLRADTKQRKG